MWPSSVDTPTCAKSVRKFNEEASKLPNTVVLCVSADLPFAASRFCAAEGLKNVSTLSTFRGSFDAYGTKIAEGPLKDLESRAVVVIGADGKVHRVITMAIAKTVQLACFADGAACAVCRSSTPSTWPRLATSPRTPRCVSSVQLPIPALIMVAALRLLSGDRGRQGAVEAVSHFCKRGEQVWDESMIPL